MEEKIMRQEQKHLQQVHAKLQGDAAELRERISAATESGRSAKAALAGDVRLNFDSFADNVDTFAAIETANREIDGRNSQLASMEHRLKAAELLLPQPYFARVDLRYTGEDEDEPLYIGKIGYATGMQEDLVYDWRAPVADAYYGGQFGPITYAAGSRTIDAELRLRRQFVIADDELHSYVDSQTAVTDPLLLDALAQSRGAQMRDITATIQAEQNALIRNKAAQVLIVDGVAGSGKTSVLLQRVAYQLFQHRGEWASADVLLLTPSKMFARYTAAVLPALGETNPLQVSLGLYAAQLGQRFDIEVRSEDVVSLDTAVVDTIFLRPLSDVEELQVKPLTAIVGEVGTMITRAFRHTNTQDNLLQRLQTTFIALGDAKHQVAPDAWLHWLQGQQWWPVNLENSALALYMIISIARFQQRNVRSLFVDEAQDYTAGQLALLAKLFGHASITLLGDHDQTLVQPDAPFLQFGSLLPRARTSVVQLHTSYRATAGITRYFAQFADRGPGLTVGAVQPDQTPPTVLTASDADDALRALIDALKLRNGDYSTAVIVPDTQTAEWIQAKLVSAGIGAETVTAGAALPATSLIAVVPLALAKGLEFDSALVVVSPNAYPATVVGRHRMYVACSRATKELTVIQVATNISK